MPLRLLLWISMMALFCCKAFAFRQAPIDTVFSFTPGEGQTTGQNAPYFPGNILGLPDTAARYEVPTVRPEHICSLGMGGEIVVGFKNAVIRDREGPDFTIFENAFFTSIGGGRIYAEPGRVSVSRDGITFVDFPFDSLTLEGCAGHTPTIGNTNPYDPAVSGGDAFDLAAIGMDSVRYIRITDISAMVKNNRQHPNWDPTITGFDLDAVLALHLEGGEPEKASFPAVVAGASRIEVVLPEHSANGVLRLFSVDGRFVDQWQWSGRSATLYIGQLIRGAYLAEVSYGNQRMTICVFYEP